MVLLTALVLIDLLLNFVEIVENFVDKHSVN